MIFLAFGLVAATSLWSYQQGNAVELIIPENGFISLNVPLTPLRLGSLSTRTTHPHFLALIQELWCNADLRVTTRNPYQFKTKGEVLLGCADQTFLQGLVHESTSCGRFARWNYRHCGRCVPCLVRRAAFHRWSRSDQTKYHFASLAIPDERHRDFDDVRSVAFAVQVARARGIPAWAGSALSGTLLGNTAPFQGVLDRGLSELAAFLAAAGVA
jgi:hypothetical protein